MKDRSEAFEKDIIHSPSHISRQSLCLVGQNSVACTMTLFLPYIQVSHAVTSLLKRYSEDSLRAWARLESRAFGRLWKLLVLRKRHVPGI